MIRMNDFTREPEPLRRLEQAAFERVMKSGRFILGNEVEQFEQDWATFCGTKYCSGVGNGMEAIELGLRALKIGRGDEVITTPMTAMATVMAIIHAGATPVLADIDSKTALLDRSSVERCLTTRTKAVLLVHLYGQMHGIDEWIATCDKAKIHFLEDCAQAHGATWNGKRAGSFGSFGAFSFYPTKNLGAKGDAGAMVTNSQETDARLKMLRNCGTRERYEHVEAGLNSRLDELQAAILHARLEWLEQFNKRRQAIAKRYFAEIKNERVELLSPPGQEQSHVYHLFVIRCVERSRLGHFLKERGIETLIHYPIPAHRQDCCSNVRRDPSGLTNAETHAAQCLSIPCHPQLRDEEVDTVIDAIDQFK